MKQGLRALGPLIASWLVVTPAAASPVFELTGAVQGDGGFNARSVESGSASAYFNPAFLPDAPSGLDLGVFAVSDQIGISLRGRPSASADVPVDVVNAEIPGGGRFDRYPLPTVWLNQGKPADPPDEPLPARPRQSAGSSHNVHTYQVLGFVQKMFAGRVALGVYAMLPYKKFTGASAFYNDEREQYFTNSLHPELYSDRLTATSIALGLGVKVHPRFSLGLASTFSLKTVAGTPTFLSDVGHFQDIMVDSDVSVQAQLSPHGAAVWQPGDWTQFAATVHSPQKMQIETAFSFFLSNGLEQRATLDFTHAYLPWIFSLGGTQHLTRSPSGGLSVVATGTYSLWSHYVDRHNQRPSDAYAWYDTLAAALGLRYRHAGARLFLDATYQPSPVPKQTGRTNYVDNDRVATSAGFDWRTEIFGGTLRLGLQAQVHRLLPQTAWKLPTPTAASGVNQAPDRVADEVPDNAVVSGQPLAGREGLQTNNPGWPGFSSAGWIVGAGVNASLTF